jgi:hypothetical protein
VILALAAFAGYKAWTWRDASRSPIAAIYQSRTACPLTLTRSGLALLHELPRLMGSASLEDRKEFVRAFVRGVSVVPGEARLDVRMHTLPAVGSLLPANSTCGLVAGARYVPVQMDLRPLERFLAGLKRAA